MRFQTSRTLSSDVSHSPGIEQEQTGGLSNTVHIGAVGWIAAWRIPDGLLDIDIIYQALGKLVYTDSLQFKRRLCFSEGPMFVQYWKH